MSVEKNTRNIVVIGASAGGYEAIQKVIANLPEGLPLSVFIVWHMSPDVRGILPDMLSTLNKYPANHATDHEPILPGRINVAPPDHHLLLQEDHMRITRGPKENRFRPAVDPLLRSAAAYHGNKVVGVILSGALDDGVHGLINIKQCGGVAIVQDPADAQVPSMPENALKAVEADFILPSAEIASAIVALMASPKPDLKKDVMQNEPHRSKLRFELENDQYKGDVFRFGDLTPYTCPECHGVLTAIKDGNFLRFHCHTGHAFSADTLLATLTENIEESLWNAIRSIQESVFLLNHMGDHFAEQNKPKLAAMYFRKAKDAEERASHVRNAVFSHENLTMEAVESESEHKPADSSEL